MPSPEIRALLEESDAIGVAHALIGAPVSRA